MNRLFVVSYDKHWNTYTTTYTILNNMSKQGYRKEKDTTQMKIDFGETSLENPMW